jgi:GABA(A) receptor-associated protein
MYRKSKSFEERLTESAKIRKKYPTRVPIIIEKLPSSDMPSMKKTKFLVPEPSEALYLFVNGSLLSGSQQLAQIYESHKSDDNFLYVQFASEATFGK